jgi:hypothetical protein
MALKTTRRGLPVVKAIGAEDLKTYKLPLFPNSVLKDEDLDKTNEVYQNNVDEWLFLKAAAGGVRELLRIGIFEKHERESQQNYVRRQKELYSLGYTKSIVDLFTFYLFQRPVHRELGELATDALWLEFAEDCDLAGAKFDDYLTDAERQAGIMGHVGVLVDKPSATVTSVADAKTQKVYPYFAIYFPGAILDFKYVRDRYNRPRLAFLKLKDDDGTYRLWWPDRWETWRKGEEDGKGDGIAVKINEGANPIGEIPFVWLYNEQTDTVGLGQSDVSDVARIDVSIIRNCSQGEEIMNYAAFPMMRKPMRRQGEDLADDTGVTAVLEFDPENPNAKPDWLPAEVSGPMTSVQEWIKMKIAEIYRASNAGGMASTEINAEAQSGAALQAQFQLLNSKLCKKAVNLERCEKDLIWFWLCWQKLQALYEEIVIERSRKYDVENLALDLANMLTASTLVISKTFKAEVQKVAARRMLPGISNELLEKIDSEIEAGPVEPAPADMFGGEEGKAPEEEATSDGSTDGGDTNDFPFGGEEDEEPAEEPPAKGKAK